ncbi:MAG: hypothetical protein AB2392_18015 [Neobacillus sp.]
MDELVTSLKEVVDNINRFNKDLEDNTDIITQLTMFRHWYYIPELNAFGPSKYIGYKDMSTSKYDRGRRKTGVDTEKILKEWFIKLPVESKKSQELMEELYRLVEAHGKKVKSNAVIHIFKNGIQCPK